MVTQFRGTAALELPSFLILNRVLSEQCEVKNNPEVGPQVRVKEPLEIPCGNVLSPADPDASYNAHRGVGQIMETYCDVEDDPTGTAPPSPPDLIMHVAVGPMNVHHGSSLEPALSDTDARTVKPMVVLADSHYGSNESLEKAKLQGVDLVLSSMPPKGSKQEKLTLEDFELYEHGRVVRCPQGHVSVMTNAGADKLQMCFEEATCPASPFHQSCCASAVGLKESRYQYVCV